MTDLNRTVLYLPKYPIDIVIWADTFTFTVPASSAGTVFEHDYIIKGMNQFSRPLGIFTIDGGVTFNDMGEFEPVPPSSGFYPTAIMPAITCNLLTFPNETQIFQCEVTRTTLAITTVTVSFVLLAIDQPSLLADQYIFRGGTTAYTSKSLFRKIALKDTPLGTGTQLVIPHGMGMVPTVGAWLNRLHGSDSTNTVGGFWNDPAFLGGTTTSATFKMDATNLYIGTNNPQSILYRVYYEA